MDKKDYGKRIIFHSLFGAGDEISARGGLADKQSTGLFGASECYALAHKLLTQFSPYFKSHHPYKQKGHNRKGRALFVGAGDG
jgi:hypothetical protein